MGIAKGSKINRKKGYHSTVTAADLAAFPRTAWLLRRKISPETKAKQALTRAINKAARLQAQPPPMLD